MKNIWIIQIFWGQISNYNAFFNSSSSTLTLCFRLNLDKIVLAKLGYDRSLLDEIVATNNKQRYEYSLDGRKIRARQGHSIPVDVELKEAMPPAILYHGTATKFLESIFKDGILPGTRLYVHLSQDEETAINVGSRHGKPYVIKIDCQKMLSDGCKFFLSNNGVWLTQKVMPEYFYK